MREEEQFQRRLLLKKFVLAEMNALNDVTTVVEHSTNVLGVDGAREMWIAVVTAVAVRGGDSQELSTNEVLGSDDVLVLLVVVDGIVWQVVSFEFGEKRLEQVAFCLDLLREQILFVEEQNDGDGLEPSVVPDVLEEGQRFAEAILSVILPEHQIVGGGRADEDDGRDVVEALNPFSSLVTLAADVEHVESNFVHLEFRLKDASCHDTTS